MDKSILGKRVVAIAVRGDDYIDSLTLEDGTVLEIKAAEPNIDTYMVVRKSAQGV